MGWNWPTKITLEFPFHSAWGRERENNETEPLSATEIAMTPPPPIAINYTVNQPFCMPAHFITRRVEREWVISLEGEEKIKKNIKTLRPKIFFA